jgi:hypothetical protein
MSNCTFSPIPGMNKDCEAFLSAVKAVAFTDPAFSFNTVADAQNVANWKAAIDTNLKMWVTRPILNSEITEAEPVTETTGFGVNIVTAFNAPGMNIYMSATPCDYLELVKLGSQNARVYLINEDGSKMGWVDATGKFKGFEAQVIARPLVAKNRENKQQQFMVMIYFKNVDEFKNAKIFNDGVTADYYLEYSIKGYSMETTVAPAGSSATVLIKERCASTKATGTWTAEIVDSSPAMGAPSISVGALTDGVAVLTIYRTGTTAPTTGDWIKFRLVTKTAAVYNGITNDLIYRY